MEMERCIGMPPPNMQYRLHGVWSEPYDRGNGPSKFEPNALLERVREIRKYDWKDSMYAENTDRIEGTPPFDMLVNPISDEEAIELTDLLQRLFRYELEEWKTAEDCGRDS